MDTSTTEPNLIELAHRTITTIVWGRSIFDASRKLQLNAATLRGMGVKLQSRVEEYIIDAIEGSGLSNEELRLVIEAIFIANLGYSSSGDTYWLQLADGKLEPKRIDIGKKLFNSAEQQFTALRLKEFRALRPLFVAWFELHEEFGKHQTVKLKDLEKWVKDISEDYKETGTLENEELGVLAKFKDEPSYRGNAENGIFGKLTKMIELIGDDELSLSEEAAPVGKVSLVSGSTKTDCECLLKAKKQIILYGPPGTGKTHFALELAREIASGDNSKVKLVQFHPSYTYEDFFEGYRPARSEGAGGEGALNLELTDGPLKQFARAAAAELESAASEGEAKKFVMVIDEINRGDLARIFGELYFLLEYRDEAIEVMYGREPFKLPSNLYFIGTMNSLDRSVATLDAAMQRRFAFVPIEPDIDSKKVKEYLLNVSEKAYKIWRALNQELINSGVGPEGLIGPTYFFAKDEAGLKLRWKYEIYPLLQSNHPNLLHGTGWLHRDWEKVEAP